MSIGWLILGGIALIAGIAISIYEKGKENKHRKFAKKHMSEGNWEGAVKEYKEAILLRLDSESKLQELMSELSQLYQENGHNIDLSKLLDYSVSLKKLSSGNKEKWGERMPKIYIMAGDFLDSLPGPKLDDKK